MTTQFTQANWSPAVAPLDIITASYQEAAITDAGEALSARDAQWGLEKLQRLIDQFNTNQQLIFNVNFTQFNLQANHAPHTIGPGGDFNVPQRPVKIVSASFILNGGTSSPVDLPVRIRDDDWWAANPLKQLVSSIVTDLYYSPDVPLGNLNFYPISNVAAPVRLETWSSISQAIDLVTKIVMPQGYWDAIVLSLAVRLCPAFNKEAPATLVGMMRDSIATILRNNDGPPRIDTNSGMPGGGTPGRPDFNFLTGMRD